MCARYMMKQKNEYQAYKFSPLSNKSDCIKKLTNIELFDHKQEIQFCSSIK
jgi:hypothetical protein